MMKELLEQQVFMYGMLGLCLLGGFVKLMLSAVYGSLVRASSHMADTGNRLFKLMRLKFEACYKLKISVHNAENFVDKYLLNHKFCGVFLHTWEKFSSQMMFLCLCLGASGAILGLIWECSMSLVLEHFGMGLLTGAFLYVLDGLCATDFKYSRMRVNAIDYFDNFLKARLENEYFRAEEMKEYRQEYFEDKPEETAAASREHREEAEDEPEEKTKTASPEPVPAKRRRSPQMYQAAEETAVGKETVRKGRKEKKGKKEQEILERNMEEMEKEKIIEDILKEYLV